MKEGTFSWVEIGVVPIYKNNKPVPVWPAMRHRTQLLENVTSYAHWVTEVIAKETRPLEENEQYSATAIYMSQSNVDFLARCFLPLDWVNLSPMTENKLDRHTYAIDTEKAIIKCSYLK
jgi:hypothetical protein